MPTYSCEHCGKPVSDELRTCPHCRRDARVPRNPCVFCGQVRPLAELAEVRVGDTTNSPPEEFARLRGSGLYCPGSKACLEGQFRRLFQPISAQCQSCGHPLSWAPTLEELLDSSWRRMLDAACPQCGHARVFNLTCPDHCHHCGFPIIARRGEDYTVVSDEDEHYRPHVTRYYFHRPMCRKSYQDAAPRTRDGCAGAVLKAAVVLVLGTAGVVTLLTALALLAVNYVGAL